MDRDGRIDDPGLHQPSSPVALPSGYVSRSEVPGPAEAPSPERTGRRRRPHSPTRTIVEWVLVIGGALLLAIVIRTFLLAAFYIPSDSMVVTLERGDRVLVNKLSYRLHDVNRGDVVVFERPAGEPDTGIKDLIKRVVGLPGEVVEGRDCRVIVKPVGEPEARYLDEPYTDGRCTSDFGPVTVPAGHLWVMGDNRPDSQDSRFFGPIDEDLVVGRAFVIIWPFGNIGWL